MKSFYFLFFLSTNCFGAPKSESNADPKIEYMIDWKYDAGEYLIYDCKNRHYACVNRLGNETCAEERNIAMEKKDKSYPCAPLSKFTDKKTCVEKNYKLVDLNAPKRFCYPK